MVGFLIQWPTLMTLLMFPILLAAYVRLAATENSCLAREHGEDLQSYKESVPAGGCA